MKAIAKATNGLLRHAGLKLVRTESLYEWQLNPAPDGGYSAASALPDEARAYLVRDNPRLVDLERHYAAFGSEVTTHNLWREGFVKDAEMAYFRGDNAYVWQLRGQNLNRMGYILAYYYLRSIDRLRLLDRATEDGAFGNFVFEIDNRLVSRDLIDSLIELYFLDSHWDLSNRKGVNILDIGAGYGRLAHRATQSFPNIECYLCTDAVPRSTFISEFYLRYRRCERAKIVPLYEIERALAGTKVDLAINVHSFSECRPDAIRWWIALLAKNRVRHLMVIPNATNCGGALLQTNDLQDFQTTIEEFGYRLIAKDPKYKDPAVHEFAINPTYLYLFELA